jgi:hypothetical protein
MKWITGILLFAFVCLCRADPSDQDGEEPKRNGKVLPVFQVVKFPNAICAGSTRNGTCYTAEECSSKGGANDGSCASGFGVCCTFVLSCGGSASENQTYIVQSSVTSLTSPCSYTICPCSTNICRIRYDLETFTIATQTLGATDETATISLFAEAIGDCVEDRFSIRGSSGSSSPQICGANTGYHMIMDNAPGETSCQVASFDIGGQTTTSRVWSIRVTQYACGDYDSSGWPGCLQYYTGAGGVIQNFGFPPTVTVPGAAGTAVTSAVTHLNNQYYDICIRRETQMCYICYTPFSETVAADGEADQVSFGIGPSPAAAIAQSAINTICVEDWLSIPGGNTMTLIAAQATDGVADTIDINRICGRIFNSAGAQVAEVTICTRHLPFKVGVNFNSEELCSDEADDMAIICEQQQFPGGIVGFKLFYTQVAC